ncbi:DUF4172 domain-containing protein [Brevundimonas sp. SPF441]|nr:DUF4172 domain-containing protein [Brevundimonas sp. SPF441]
MTYIHELADWPNLTWDDSASLNRSPPSAIARAG